jgi:hypothetical protein
VNIGEEEGWGNGIGTGLETEVGALETVLKLADGLADIIASSALLEEVEEVVGYFLGVWSW